METIVHCLSSVLFSFAHVPWLAGWGTTAAIVAAVLFLLWLVPWLTLRYIPNDRVGIVEKLWSASGSVPEGRIIALGARPATRPSCCAVACTSAIGAGNTAFIRRGW